MNRSAFLYVCFMSISIAATPTAWSQCCPGARHGMSDSLDGRFRVKAESLTRLGHHGPYHFKFIYFERTESGEYRELESFELKWNVTDHFSMKLLVSPIGNGFAVDFPDGCLTFYSRDGRQLFQLDSDHRLDPERDDNKAEGVLEAYLKNHRSFELDDDGYNVHILKTVWFGNSGMHTEDSNVFLPLGLEATDLIDAQVIWYLQENLQGNMYKHSDEVLIATAMANVTRTAEPSEADINELLKYGFMALPKIEEALQQTSGSQMLTRLRNLKKVLEPWQKASTEAGRRDLDLIASMLFYPDSAIRQLARARLEQLLQVPKEKMTANELHDWVRSQQGKLQWDAAAMNYIRTDK